MAVTTPVPSDSSHARTEFRCTGLISTSRMRPSTVNRPGLVSEPIGVTPTASSRLSGVAVSGVAATRLAMTCASGSTGSARFVASVSTDLVAWRSFSTRTRLSTS
jgi:hypothetical protein